jgi:hypothetical protein
MRDEVLSERPLEEESLHFHSERDGWGWWPWILLVVGVLGTFRSLWEILIWQVDGFWDGVVEVFMPIPYAIFATLGIVCLTKGRKPDGLLIDEEGIEDRTDRFPNDRVYWSEIKAIFPINKSILGISVGRFLIGLNLTDTYLRRKSALTRFRVWWNRHITRKADIYLYTGGMSEDRDEVLTVLQDRLDQYEIRAISEAKQLESGSQKPT